ncbi:MAG: hypothetical protein F6K23_07625 [Okeania sp. SIO2C9]|uniref:hypothetical protein n=1 Tax=Okeania sp. SIO2C9 TaxID=2607791 RepID=UPI0013C00215|nr:hypothetical protein [Okeania sp. SIO2C9]NEQ72950.1 hypothetical protein [Okeania sp. SIO2C9]
MSYSDFDLKKVKAEFNLKIIETEDLFSQVEPVEISNLLAEMLKQNVPIALAIATEKASSELIIINILLEIKRQLQISFFSGIDFSVDRDKGLNGFCDFIISQSPEQLYLDTPVIVLVEAKNEKIVGGLGQCIAEMVGAEIYNQKDGKDVPFIYGAVTTGHVWKFLKLEKNVVFIDVENYYIKDSRKIIGIFVEMVRSVKSL